MEECYDIEAYARLVERIQASGRPLTGFQPNAVAGCLLRLDIDYDLDWAVRTAEINASHGVAATYFVLMSAELYNPASADGRRAVERLAELGQILGLHYHHREAGPLDRWRLEQEFSWLADLAPSAQRVVAWHNPEGDLAPLNLAAAEAGFVSAYDLRWFGPDRYVSDSNLRHMPEAIAQFVETASEPLVQVLLHPFNWIAGGAAMDDILGRTLAHKIDLLLEAFDGNRVWRQSAGPPIRTAIHASDWYRKDRRP